VKQYAPVPKGNLLLPGGPSWSSLRRHVVAAGSEPHLPTLDCIVIVEGDNDQRAVCRAVNAHVRTHANTLPSDLRPSTHCQHIMRMMSLSACDEWCFSHGASAMLSCNHEWVAATGAYPSWRCKSAPGPGCEPTLCAPADASICLCPLLPSPHRCMCVTARVC
jgi:hypothetical protein